TRTAGPLSGVSPVQFRERLSQLDKALERLKGEVEKRENEYASEAAGVRILDRAQIAMRKGLGGRARDMLLGSDVSAFGAQGMALGLDLLLKTGRLRDVLDWPAEPEQQEALGDASYHWLRAQALAAAGDYGPAQKECDKLAVSSWGEGEQ